MFYGDVRLIPNSLACLLNEGSLIGRAVFRPGNNPQRDPAGLALVDLRLPDVNHIFEDVVHPSQPGAIAQHDVILYAAIYVEDYTPRPPARAGEIRWCHCVTRIVANKRRSGICEAGPDELAAEPVRVRHELDSGEVLIHVKVPVVTF